MLVHFKLTGELGNKIREKLKGTVNIALAGRIDAAEKEELKKRRVSLGTIAKYTEFNKDRENI